MANYNNNDRSKVGYFDQYVNFDQFLMQHNINNWSPLRGQQSNFAPPSPHQFNSNSSFQSFKSPDPIGAFYFQPQSHTSGYSGTSDWAHNSNLTATASEFIPQHTSNAPSGSSLLATASEFIPRNPSKFDLPPTVGFNREFAQPDPVSCDNGKTLASNSAGDNASKTESVIEALSNTHISGGEQTEAIALKSSGGAIKKVRSQDYRNDSRDRHSNGDLYTSKRQMERYDDYRRRKNDNMRQNSGRATKYDSNRNYRNKNENFEDDSPTNNKKKNRFNNTNKGSSTQMNEKSNNSNSSNNSNGTNSGCVENGQRPQSNRNAKNDWNKKKEKNESKNQKDQKEQCGRNFNGRSYWNKRLKNMGQKSYVTIVPLF